MIACFVYALFICLFVSYSQKVSQKERENLRALRSTDWSGEVIEKTGSKSTSGKEHERHTEQTATQPGPGNIKENMIWKRIK